MFGLESQKKKKPGNEFEFDLEKKCQNPAEIKKVQELVMQRVQKIKEILRVGGDQEDIERLGTLLHGYHSLLKVTSRFQKQK
jgi:hypothetical protein